MSVDRGRPRRPCRLRRYPIAARSLPGAEFGTLEPSPFCYLAAETDSVLAGKKSAWGIANSLWAFKAD